MSIPPPLHSPKFYAEMPVASIFGLAFPATTRFGLDEKTGVPLQKIQPYTSFYGKYPPRGS